MSERSSRWRAARSPSSAVSSSSRRARAAVSSLRRLRSVDPACRRAGRALARAFAASSPSRSRCAACAPRFWRARSRSFSRAVIACSMPRACSARARAVCSWARRRARTSSCRAAKCGRALGGGHGHGLGLADRAHEGQQLAGGVEPPGGHRTVRPEHLAGGRHEGVRDLAALPELLRRAEARDDNHVPEQVLGHRSQVGRHADDVQHPGDGAGRGRGGRGGRRAARGDGEEGPADRGALLEHAGRLDADGGRVHEQALEPVAEDRLEGDLVLRRHLQRVGQQAAQAAAEVGVGEHALEFLLEPLRPAAEVALELGERGETGVRGVKLLARGGERGVDLGRLPAGARERRRRRRAPRARCTRGPRGGRRATRPAPSH